MQVLEKIFLLVAKYVWDIVDISAPHIVGDYLLDLSLF
jgi:hypothetical protein